MDYSSAQTIQRFETSHIPFIKTCEPLCIAGIEHRACICQASFRSLTQSRLQTTAEAGGGPRNESQLLKSHTSGRTLLSYSSLARAEELSPYIHRTEQSRARPFSQLCTHKISVGRASLCHAYFITLNPLFPFIYRPTPIKTFLLVKNYFCLLLFIFTD